MSCPLDMLYDRVRTTVHYHLIEVIVGGVELRC